MEENDLKLFDSEIIESPCTPSPTSPVVRPLQFIPAYVNFSHQVNMMQLIGEDF